MMSGTSNQQNAVEAPAQNALIKAVENDDVREVKRLIDAGVPVDETDNRGMNALFEAVRCCNGTLVHLLVEEGKAFVNARDLYGRTPLFYAITQSKEIAAYLIEKGADVNLKDFTNRSALSFFVENCMMNENILLSSLISDKAEEFQMLKDPSEDVNHGIIKTILGIVICKLPLMYASSKIPDHKTRKLNRETIEKIRKVASIYFAENDTKKKAILDNILKDCEGKKTFSATCDEVILLLVEIGADPNFADSDGNTALHHAASLSFLGVSTEVIMSMFGQLERYGLTLNTRNHRNETPLLFCLSGIIGHLEENDRLTAMKTLVEVCKFLVTRGSNFEETTQNGESVFHLVIKLFQQGFEIPEQTIRHNFIDETMKILHLFSYYRLVKGSTVNKGDSRLNSPLHCWAKLTLPFHPDYSNSFETTLKDILEHLLQLGATLNPRNEDEETPLHVCKTWRAVKLLLAEGANPNDVDSSGRSPIITAVKNKTYLMKPDVDQSNNESVVRALIDAGADVNMTDSEGKTALFYAVRQSNNESVVHALIDAGADVNMTDSEGKTALFHVVQQSDNESVVHALIDAGADVNMTDSEGKTALFHVVQQSDNESVVRGLIDAGADVNMTDEEKTVLLYAVAKENEKLVKKLITCGADINATDKDGKTALFYAVDKENEKMLATLIECGADVNATDKNGETALFYGVRKENETMVEKLIECRADINATDKDGKTAFFYAVDKENEIMLATLIKCGADINVHAENGITPLIYAVCKENEKMAGKLIECGADVNATNKHGETALFYAMTQSLSLARYLLDKGATLHLNENCSVLTFFIEECFFSLSGGKTNLQDGLNLLSERKEVKGKTILEAIASVAFCKTLYFNPGSCDIDVDSLSKLMRLAKGNTSTLKVLLPVGKNKIITQISNMIHKQSHDKPLIESRAALELPRLLIKLGANPNTSDSDGNTALHHATQLAFHGVTRESTVEIFQQLEKLIVSYHITNHQNETPLLYCLTRTIEKVSREEEPWPAVKTQAAVCRFLVKHGSKHVEAKTGSGETVLHLTIKLLQQGFFTRNNELRKDVSDVTLELLEVIVLAFRNQDVSTNTQDKSGNLPLHLWAKLELAPGQDYWSNITDGYTFKEILKMILDQLRESRTLLHVKNEEGETPLHLCSTWTAVELLLDAGANPNDVDSSGRSPLLIAARNNESVHNRGSLYPDILLAPDTFWKTVLKKGLNPWTVDRQGESVLSVLITSESNELARAMVDVACDQDSPAYPLVLFTLLNTICRDKLPNAQWKKDAAEKLLRSTKCPVNGNAKEDSPLHYCCRNIVQASKSLSNDEIKTTVHWSMVKLLRSFGADFRIPDATNQSCLAIAEKCPALKELLMEPIDLDRFSVFVKPWKSVSKTHERSLAKVARHLESEYVESCWYHKDHLARGSFGAVFAGINEKDGREVAIKRIEKIRMQRLEDKREITNLTALADCEQFVRYLRFFEDEHFSDIVLELTEGNLDQFLNTAVQMDTKVSLCQDVAKGLKFLHDRNIIHRDLKSSNILYKSHPKLCFKIADFGLSRRMDSTGSSTSVYGSDIGTRSWIAPEVLKSTKAYSKSSDVFAFGLVLHSLLTGRTHPFEKRRMVDVTETENNIADKREGWDVSLFPETEHLLKAILHGIESKRLAADNALDHPFFWSKKKKLDLLIAVGNQPECECPRAKRTLPLTAVEIDLEKSFGTIVKYVNWNDPCYVHMPAIYTEMTTRRSYKTNSIVELVRFIRNAYAHVAALPKLIQDQLLKHFVFLEYFPNLVMEVYTAVTTHGWDQKREEIKYAMKK